MGVVCCLGEGERERKRFCFAFVNSQRTPPNGTVNKLLEYVNLVNVPKCLLVSHSLPIASSYLCVEHYFGALSSSS